MIVPDVNLLVYAVNADSPHHQPARDWWVDLLSGDRPVGLAWIVILAFLRLTTRAGVFEKPLAADAALGYVEEWLAQPSVRIVTPTVSHWGTLRALLRASGTAGNLSSDAHLAAIAIGHAAALATADRDFRRFPGLDVTNPLADQPSRD